MSRATMLILGLAFLGAATPAAARESVAERGEVQLTKIVADRIQGQPVNCIRLGDIQSSEIIDGTAIVYESFGGRLYVNRPASGAQSLRQDDILVTKTWNGDLCSVDIVRLVEAGSRFEHGFVGLSQFVPYERPKRSKG